MFSVPPLPRTLAACERDLAHPQVAVRLSTLGDLGRAHPEQETEGRVDLCILALRDESSLVRKRALVALADLGAARAVPQVLSLLSDAEIEVRQMAVLCLGEIAKSEDEEVLGRLATLLKAGSARVRYQALLARCQLSPKDVTPDLLTALSDPDEEVRELAVRLCDEIVLATGEAAPAALKQKLLSACQDSSARVALVAQLVSGEKGWPAPRDKFAELVWRRMRARELRDEQLALSLVGKLQLTELIPAVRRRALGAFGSFGLSFDPFRWLCLSTLYRLGDEQAGQRLMKALRSRRFLDRTISAKSLGESGQKAAESALLALRGQDRLVDQEVLESALVALAEFPAKSL